MQYIVLIFFKLFEYFSENLYKTDKFEYIAQSKTLNNIVVKVILFLLCLLLCFEDCFKK